MQKDAEKRIWRYYFAGYIEYKLGGDFCVCSITTEAQRSGVISGTIEGVVRLRGVRGVLSGNVFSKDKL